MLPTSPMFPCVAAFLVAASPNAREPRAAPAPDDTRDAVDDGHGHGQGRDHAHERHGHAHLPEHEGARRVEVELHDTGPSRTRKAPSEVAVDLEEVRRVPRATPESLLELSPGVVVGSFAEAAHPGTVFVRGFESDDGKDLETTVDGIPINEIGNTDAHGFADTRFLIPELVAGVRLAQGSFDPVQGDFAVAGSADFSVGLADRGLHHVTTVDTWGKVRTALLYGPAGRPAGTFVAADVEGGPSYGEQRDVASLRAMAGYEHDFGGHMHLRVLGSYYHNDFRHPGVVRIDDARAGRVPCASDTEALFCAYDPRLGGRFDRASVGARVFRHVGALPFSLGGYVVGKHHRLVENFTGFTTDLDHPGGPRGDGIEQGYAFVALGVRGSLGMRGTWHGRSQGFDVGFDVRSDHGRARLERLRFDDGTPYATLFDHRFVVRHLATYASAHLEPARSLAIDGGLRMATFAAHVVDLEGGRRSRPMPAVALLPRASVTVGTGSMVEWTTAYGQGLRSADPNGLVGASFIEPTRTHAAESGVRLFGTEPKGIGSFDGRMFGYYTFVERDLVFDEEDGRNRDIGASHRFGAGVAFTAEVADVFTLRAGGSYARAHVRDDGAPWRIARGKAVPYVPRLAARIDAVAGHDFDVRGEHFVWHVAVGATMVGHRPLPSGRFGPGYAVADASADLRWRWVEVGVAVRNLTNARYFPVQLEYASSFDPRTAEAPTLPALHVAPGAPLTAMFTLRLHYEPGEWRHFVHDHMDRRRKEKAT